MCTLNMYINECGYRIFVSDVDIETFVGCSENLDLKTITKVLEIAEGTGQIIRISINIFNIYKF